jgi:hypothetical protein
VYKLDLFQSYAGQRLMNSLCFARKTEPAPTQAELAALALDWKNFMLNHQLAQLTHTGWVAQQLSGTDVSYTAVPCTRQGGLRFEGLHTGTVVGGNAGDGMPPQSAIVTTISTGISGRSRRGRFYLGGWGEGFQNNGTITAGIVTSQQTAWDAQLAKFSPTGTNATWYSVVWSHTIATGCKPAAVHPHAMTAVGSPSPGTASAPVVQFKVRDVVYTQRRRTIGVGS